MRHSSDSLWSSMNVTLWRILKITRQWQQRPGAESDIYDCVVISAKFAEYRVDI